MKGWAECRARIVAPCHALSAFGPEHLTCLRHEREQCVAFLNNEVAQVSAELTDGAARDLPALMEGWHVPVAPKCEMVSADRAHISADAAWLGCEIVETAGLSLAMQQYRFGQADADFCDLKD